MVNVTFQITRLMMLFAVLCAGSSVFAQVDGGKPSQDTLYIIEEEVLYDTLYLYDTLPQPALMSKEELLVQLHIGASPSGIGLTLSF